eukprot:scaffold10796_cov114-Isochrysis_galbana.AAC.3
MWTDGRLLVQKTDEMACLDAQQLAAATLAERQRPTHGHIRHHPGWREWTVGCARSCMLRNLGCHIRIHVFGSRLKVVCHVDHDGVEGLQHAESGEGPWPARRVRRDSCGGGRSRSASGAAPAMCAAFPGGVVRPLDLALETRENRGAFRRSKGGDAKAHSPERGAANAAETYLREGGRRLGERLHRRPCLETGGGGDVYSDEGKRSGGGRCSSCNDRRDAARGGNGSGNKNARLPAPGAGAGRGRAAGMVTAGTPGAPSHGDHRTSV